MAATPYPNSIPTTHAARKRNTTWERWNGELGRWVREFTPRVFPGTPPSAIMGFASNGSGDEVTELEELGYFGIGRLSGWQRLARSSTAQRLLGGVASDVWQASRGGTKAQVAVGLANLLEDGQALQTKLETWGLPKAREDSLWGIACSFASWSAGSDSAAGHFRPYLSALQGPRWGALRWATADALRSGRVAPGTPGSHAGSSCYTMLRTEQKIAVGRLLERDAGGGRLSWYDDGLSDAVRAQVDDVLARAGSPGGGSVSGLALGALGSGSTWAKVAGVVGVGTGLGLLVRAYLRRRR